MNAYSEMNAEQKNEGPKPLFAIRPNVPLNENGELSFFNTPRPRGIA